MTTTSESKSTVHYTESLGIDDILDNQLTHHIFEIEEDGTFSRITLSHGELHYSTASVGDPVAIKAVDIFASDNRGDKHAYALIPNELLK